jgi:hypothetical protein
MKIRSYDEIDPSEAFRLSSIPFGRDASRFRRLGYEMDRILDINLV